MKLLMILYSGSTPDRISALLDQHEVPGWTQLAHARGAGTTGRRDASRAWPGESTVFVTVLPDERAQEIGAVFRAWSANAAPAERLHLAVLPVERFC